MHITTQRIRTHTPSDSKARLTPAAAKVEAVAKVTKAAEMHTRPTSSTHGSGARCTTYRKRIASTQPWEPTSVDVLVGNRLSRPRMAYYLSTVRTDVSGCS